MVTRPGDPKSGPPTGKGPGASIAQAPQLNQLATAYEDVLQPQLSGSRLAPVVLGIGQRVPGVGKFGPRDLPRKTPKATPVPSPTPQK